MARHPGIGLLGCLLNFVTKSDSEQNNIWDPWLKYDIMLNKYPVFTVARNLLQRAMVFFLNPFAIGLPWFPARHGNRTAIAYY